MIYKSLIVTALFGVVLFSSPAFSKDDSRRFLQNAFQGGMSEIKQAQSALKKASDPDVQAFAKGVVADQTPVNKHIKVLAAKKSVGLPIDVTPKQEAVLYRLSKLKDRNYFDRKYIAQNLKDHQKAVRAFEKQVEEGTDADVRALAADALPQLKRHLETATTLSTKLNLKSREN